MQFDNVHICDCLSNPNTPVTIAGAFRSPVHSGHRTSLLNANTITHKSAMVDRPSLRAHKRARACDNWSALMHQLAAARWLLPDMHQLGHRCVPCKTSCSHYQTNGRLPEGEIELSEICRRKTMHFSDCPVRFVPNALRLIRNVCAARN